MSNVVRLFPPDAQENLILALEDIVQRAKSGEISSFIFSAKCSDGNVATAYGKVNFGERAELIGHLQCDLSYAMIEANIDRLVEKL